jgi:hypothetical protein
MIYPHNFTLIILNGVIQKMSGNRGQQHYFRENSNEDLYLSPTSSIHLIKKHRDLLNHLRHASSCEDPNCQQIPKCSQKKVTWRHVALCRGQMNCAFPGCQTSSYVLSHYAHFCRGSTSASITSQSPKKHRSPANYCSQSQFVQPIAYEEQEAISILSNLSSPQSSPTSSGIIEIVGSKRKIERDDGATSSNSAMT